jgi:hypothetical protein
MSRPNSISLSTFHSTVENMSGIAEAVHFPLSTRLIKAWKGGKETAGQKEEGIKAVSHHTPDADNNLERQGPMAGRGGCMLMGETYTPDLNAEATTAILPLLPAHLRTQALRLLAQLSEHGCYSEKASAGEAGQSQLGFEGSRQRASRDGHGWQEMGAFLSAKLPLS